MPVQKGKRRRRNRRRHAGDYESVDDVSAAARPVATSPQKASRPRSGWRRPPLAVNLVIGLAMLAFGVASFFLPQKGMGVTQRIIFLILYLAVAAWYLGTAMSQYRARRR